MTTAVEGPRVRCPSCGYELNCHHCTTSRGGTPKPGDVVLCWRCASPAVFFQSLTGLAVRVPDETEMRVIKCDPAVSSALDTIRGRAR